MTQWRPQKPAAPRHQLQLGVRFLFDRRDHRHQSDKDTRLDQLADYLVTAGMTNTDLDCDLESAPSILRLFALSKALYESNQTSRTQRSEIAERVARDVLALMSAESVTE
jgi:hypothetical protein